MFVQSDLDDQLPDDGAHDDEEGSVSSQISTETKCCIYSKVRNAPEGMLPPMDPWDIEALIERSMVIARQVIDASDVDEKEQQDGEIDETPWSTSSAIPNLRFSCLKEILSQTKVRET